MHEYVIVDRLTGERTELMAPNRDAALKAYVRRRLNVVRVPPQRAPDLPPAGPPADPGAPQGD